MQPAPGQCPIDAAVQAGVLQQQEGQQLQAAEQARRAVIAVDAFDKQYLQPIPGQVR
ncbi:hypothetical protein D3C78_1726210 [compost metagenome]